MSAERISKLPKWAQREIASLQARVDRAEATIPWTKPGMEWFTLFHPDVRAKDDNRVIRLFTLGEEGSQCVAFIHRTDCVFIGRGKRL